MHDGMRVLKTWVNSWHTSDRYHESVRLPCIWGCADALDKLSHYVMCPYLFGLIKHFFPPASHCPVERLGLVEPTREKMLCVACTFGGYHAARRFISSELASIESNSDAMALHPNFACTLTALSDSHSLAVGVRAAFCEAFWADAVDSKLKCVHYTAPESCEQLKQLYGLITDTDEDANGVGSTELSVPLVASVVVAATDEVHEPSARLSVQSTNALCGFFRAREANAHNPFLHPDVQSMPVTPVDVREIPPTGVVGGAGVFTAPVD